MNTTLPGFTRSKTRWRGSMIETKGRVGGGQLGVAACDALGATVEFLGPSEIRSRFRVHREVVGGGAFNQRPGEGTDDTDLTWAVLSAYVNGRYTLGRVADDMLEWSTSNPWDIGGAISQARNRLQRTGAPHKSGNTGGFSCGNGSLMRCLPTVLARPDTASGNWPRYRRSPAPSCVVWTAASPTARS